MRTAVARALAPSLAELLVAVLDRPAPAAPDFTPCDCATCRALRATPFSCGNCGYHGAPLVHACSCDSMAAAGELIYETWRRCAETGRREDGRRLSRATRERLRDLVARYDERDAHGCPAGKDSLCAHGCVECPVCLGNVDEDRKDGSAPWGMIRDLRALLAEHGFLVARQRAG